VRTSGRDHTWAMGVILVTGTSSGFGLLTAAELVRRGHRVVATMRDPAHSEALRATIADGDGDGAALEVETLDVTDTGSVRRAIKTVIARHGRLDVVVNNAGIGTAGAVEETAVDEFAAVFDTNVLGALRVIQAALPHMRERRSGHIVNVTSIAAFVAPPFLAAYAASKHALDAIGESLAGEVGRFGIAVTNVAPGAYDTRMTQDVDEVLASVDPSSPYAEPLSTLVRNHAASMRQNDDPRAVAVAVADAIEADPPPARVVVPPESGFIVEARGATPPEQLRDLLAKSYGI